MVYRPSQEKIEQNIVTELMGHAGHAVQTLFWESNLQKASWIPPTITIKVRPRKALCDCKINNSPSGSP